MSESMSAADLAAPIQDALDLLAGYAARNESDFAVMEDGGAALDALVARCEQAEAGAEWHAVENLERAESAEDRVAELEAALRWYAERRNYMAPAPSMRCPQHETTYCEVFHTDSWDEGGPGARARAALAAAPADPWDATLMDGIPADTEGSGRG